MGRVVYLTGAPATCKSTLCEYLAARVRDLSVYSYSKLLRDHIRKSVTTALDGDDIRRQSATVVTREVVTEVDGWLVNEISQKRDRQHAIIDSHAVTKEPYGFRVTPFSTAQLRALAPDVIICLYASPEVIIERVRANPAGRPDTSSFETGLHVQIQAELAAQYSFHMGVPLYLIDSSRDLETVAATMMRLTKIAD